MRRVLVTGASGFLGRHCLESLKEHAGELHAVSTQPRHQPAGVEWHRADLLDPGEPEQLLAVVQPSHLLHLAWLSDRRKIYESDENLRWAAASAHLFEAFAARGGERLVCAGSCAEYDWSEGVCSEQRTPLEPATAYGAAKVDLFRRFEALTAAGETTGAWGRVFFLYGPGEKAERLLPSVILSILDGRPARCTHGEQRRDYLYVVDAARALVDLLAGEIEGAVNIGSGEAIPIKELVLAAARRLGREDLVRLGELPSPPDEAPLVQAEVGRLVGEVGWHPRYDLEQGLSQTIDYWCRRAAG